MQPPTNVSPELTLLSVANNPDAPRNAFPDYYPGSLHGAVADNDEKLLRALLSHGADLQTGQGTAAGTPLHAAVTNKRTDCVKLLLQMAADVMQVLLTHGIADIPRRAYRLSDYSNSPTRITNFLEKITNRRRLNATPLLCQINDLGHSPELLRTLIDHGVDVNAADKDRNTPLHHCIENCDDSINPIEPLLQAGADPNACNSTMNTPLHVALTEGECSRAHLRSLIAHGADIRIRNQDGHTPLSLAVSLGHLPETQLLLESGITPIESEQELLELCPQKKRIVMTRLLRRYLKPESNT